MDLTVILMERYNLILEIRTISLGTVLLVLELCLQFYAVLSRVAAVVDMSLAVFLELDVLITDLCIGDCQLVQLCCLLIVL